MATAYPTIEEDENLLKGNVIEKEEYKLPTPLRDYKDNRKNLEILKQLKELVSDTDMEHHVKQLQEICETKEVKENRKTEKLISKETLEKSNQESNEEDDMLSDNETQQGKTKLPAFLSEHQVNRWKQLANKLNKEEIQLLLAEIQKGLE